MKYIFGNVNETNNALHHCFQRILDEVKKLQGVDLTVLDSFLCGEKVHAFDNFYVSKNSSSTVLSSTCSVGFDEDYIDTSFSVVKIVELKLGINKGKINFVEIEIQSSYNQPVFLTNGNAVPRTRTQNIPFIRIAKGEKQFLISNEIVDIMDLEAKAFQDSTASDGISLGNIYELMKLTGMV